ncbi:endogenous retrovirus group K member 21 Gag polyprotein-like isoform X2 [Macaca fascicularis]|uniref:endogenous retrovirus group K member 21 Gag polyprotein-like isoform X2 n=1 Tax=Macaca fascicularis TaxID=9541 RepID=UPI0032B07165
MAMPIQIQCPQYQPVEDKTQPPVAYQYWPPAELQYRQPPENPYGQPGTFPVPQGRAPYPQPPTMRLNPTAPPSTQGSALHKIIDEARKQGDIEAWQFPVILEARPPGEGAQERELPVAEARYKSFSIKMLKEMKEGVKQYEPNSPYMRTLLDSIAHGHRLIPYDWECLGDGEGTRWRKVNKMEQSLLFPGSSSQIFPYLGKIPVPGKRTKSTEHAQSDVKPGTPKFKKPLLHTRPKLLPLQLPGIKVRCRKDTGSLIAPPAGQALRLNVVPLLKGQKVPSSSYTWMTTDGAHTRRPRSPSPSLGRKQPDRQRRPKFL